MTSSGWAESFHIRVQSAAQNPLTPSMLVDGGPALFCRRLRKMLRDQTELQEAKASCTCMLIEFTMCQDDICKSFEVLEVDDL